MQTRNLPCKLSRSEKAQFAATNAVAVQEHIKLQAEKKSSASHYAELIKKKNEEIAKCSNCATTGIEYRDIVCYDRPNRLEGLMETIRSDAGEVVDSRHLNPREMQMSMDELLPERPPITIHRESDDDDHFGDE